jgi:glycosyltransferase involved in cell wall biosynthesis
MADPRKTDSYRSLFSTLEPLAGPHLDLSIAGDGPNRQLIEEMAAPLMAKNMRVVFHGEIPHVRMPKFFSTGDIFAWPGMGEAFGLTYLEAQASGLPVAAEPSLGVRSVISEFAHGNAQPLPKCSGFSSMLIPMISSLEHACSRGQTAQKWVLEHRSLASAANRLVAIFDGFKQ